MINNKGQVLVIFIILLPIIILMLMLIVDLGLIFIEKRKIDNNVRETLEFYLDNIDDENIKNKAETLLNNNLKDINITFIDNIDSIQLIVNKKYKCVFSNYLDSDINIMYYGMKNTKKIIKG